jgi:hypothetical protein
LTSLPWLSWGPTDDGGHGLAQAPHVGTLIADAIVDGQRHEDLETLWMAEPTFPRLMMMSRFRPAHTLAAVDRFNDLFNGRRRHARRGWWRWG